MTEVPAIRTRYSALASDYDGTIASGGLVDEPTVVALERARAAGLALLLVTGRELIDLFRVFDRHALFDLIVAENGAVLHDSARGDSETLGEAPPSALLDALARQGIPFSVGRSIVATNQPHERALRSVIRDLAIDWHVILNKESVMALPRAVTKATGLQAALVRLGLTPERTVGVGDAENDREFLRICGLAVAVANALPSMKNIAHVITTRSCGAGVREMIDMLLSGQLEDAAARRACSVLRFEGR
jgi:hydroxymethylpyrimidine pyrophosphatase-like HAD family hydrolase